MDRIRVYHERLEHERERMLVEREKREAECKDRREERASRDRLDLDTFILILTLVHLKKNN